ncbi:hypothetical protein BGZ60DRAFT_565601 [Tricladium varicosporioides]|nr:hypothetical protein BGZ60DRAFT_565601 [Hymenoscyphus varicosporioides]
MPTIPPPPKQGFMNSLKSRTGGGTIELETPLVLTSEPLRIDLEVIGVWNTVGALGIPESKLSKFTDVKRAYQALSLDDHRGAFTPSLWYLKDLSKEVDEKTDKPLAILKDIADL